MKIIQKSKNIIQAKKVLRYIFVDAFHIKNEVKTVYVLWNDLDMTEIN